MKNSKTIFYILAFIYALLFLIKKIGIYVPLISDYLADLICVPLTVIAIQLFMRHFVNRNFETRIAHVLVAVIYFSVVFEWIMPGISNRYTADGIDVICYFSGGILFYIFSEREKLFLKRVKPV